MSMVACGSSSSSSGGDSNADGGMGGSDNSGGSESGGSSSGGSDNSGGSDGSGGSNDGACDEGTFDDDDDPETACVAWTDCAAGTFVSTAGSATKDRACFACASGTFTEGQNAESCATWTTCVAGTFVSNTPSATEDRVCEPCPSDTFTSGTNQSECLPQEACDAGTVQTSPGTSAGLPVCDACQPGEYCAGGEAPKEPCAVGSWDHDNDPTTECVLKTDCLAGNHVADEGTTTTDRTCDSCEGPTFTTDKNQQACSPWKDCVAGLYVANEPSNTEDRVCEACVGDTYTPDANLSECLPQQACAAGTVQTAEGTPSSLPVCEVCEAGTYCAGDEAPKVPCGDEEWDDDQKSATACIAKKKCIPGEQVQGDGSATSDRSCEECPDETFSTADNTELCTAYTACVEGLFVDVQGTKTADQVCEDCAAGTFTDEPDLDSCQAWSDCAIGTAIDEDGTATSDRTCVACAPGTHALAENMDVCVTCNPNVLVIDDVATVNDPVFKAALEAAGLVPTWGANVTTYTGSPSSSSYGAVYLSPGSAVYLQDIPAGGQSSIVTAVNAGTGLVMTEWTSYNVQNGRYQQLASLILLPRTNGTTAPATITPTLTDHYVWTGIGSSFDTITVSWNTGSTLTNGGVSLGSCSACAGPVGAVRDSVSAGRVVQLAHAGDYWESGGSPEWTSDPNLLKMTVNSVVWATKCVP
jgi:hypothetical protein